MKAAAPKKKQKNGSQSTLNCQIFGADKLQEYKNQELENLKNTFLKEKGQWK